jgi:membrane metallo-endopeptidase-like protein 1
MPSRTYMIKGQEDPMVQAYQRLATNIAIAFGAGAAEAEDDMRDVVAFEIRLANVIPIHCMTCTFYLKL